jgi:hypothetical protein
MAIVLYDEDFEETTKAIIDVLDKTLRSREMLDMDLEEWTKAVEGVA